MTTYSLTVVPSLMEYARIYNDEVFRDANGGIWSAGRNGNRWSFTLTYNNVRGANLGELSGFVGLMRGATHRARLNFDTLFKYSTRARQGTYGGTPVLASEASAGATTLSVSGATATVTDWAKRGDFITCDGELKQVVEDADSDGGGLVTLNIWPEVHETIAISTAVEIGANVQGDFALIEASGLGAIPHPSEWLTPTAVLIFEEDVSA